MNQPVSALYAGLMQGQGAPAQGGGSITPNATQPMGSPGPTNILSGSLRIIVDQLNKTASLLSNQGVPDFVGYATELMKAAYMTNRVLEKIEKDIQEPNG